MSAETLFTAANLAGLVGWMLLIVAPRNPRALVVAGTGIPIALSFTYLILLVVHLGEGRGGFSSLQGVQELFSNPWLLLAGWIHYVAFDLFVGAWEARDATHRGLPRWLLIPCLGLTFVLGPIGFLVYHATRTFFTGARKNTSQS